MSNQIRVLRVILQSKKPLTAHQVASISGVREKYCQYHLFHLVKRGQITQVGVIIGEGQAGRPRILYSKKASA